MNTSNTRKLLLSAITSVGLAFGVTTAAVAASPVARAEAPSPGESDHGMVLDEDQLRAPLAGFKGAALFPIVAVAAFTSAPK